MENLIIYLGQFSFPYGQAASKRVLGNVKVLRALGYNVIVGHGGDLSHEMIDIGAYNLGCYGLGELFQGKNNVLKLYSHIFLSGKNTIDWLNSLEVKPKFIICYGGYYSYSRRILNYCKKNDIKLIFDLVEWYEPNQMLGGKYGFFYNSFLLAFNRVYPKADGIVAISRNLEHVFSNNISVVIPPLEAIVSQEIIETKKNNLLTLVYAGNIGNKDYLLNIIHAVSRLEKSHNLLLKIYGPTENQIKTKFNLDVIPNSVKIFGKVDQEKINSYINSADFTIFTRPDSHCNKYGFPSKFVESLSLGVPVATNLTSDLGLYLKDEYNGFIIDEITIESIESTILRMLKLSDNQKIEMKKNALKTVDECFSSQSSALKKSIADFLYMIERPKDGKA